MNRKDLGPQCFCCTILLGIIFMEWCFLECYANELCITTCIGVLGHRIRPPLGSRVVDQILHDEGEEEREERVERKEGGGRWCRSGDW
jgi:hypothetical protein